MFRLPRSDLLSVLLFTLIVGLKFESVLPDIPNIIQGNVNSTHGETTPGEYDIQFIDPVSISWLSNGRPLFLLSDFQSSSLAVVNSIPKSFLGVPLSFHQPTRHPYSDRNTAKEADNAGRTSTSEWSFWLTILIAMVAAAILS